MNALEHNETHNYYYRESGKVHLPGMAASWLLYLLLAIFLGYSYSAVSTLIPFIYFNVLITIALGILLGLIVRVMVRLTHNRNKKSQYLQGFIFGFLVWLFQWGGYIVYFAIGEIPSVTTYLTHVFPFLLPQNFFPIIAEINETGLWSVFGLTLNGFWLGFIWFIEAVIIIGMPVLAVYQTKIYPYSELLCKWYPKYTLNKDFESISGLSHLEKKLITDPFAAIQNLDKGTGLRHSKIHLFFHKNENRHYLTVEKVFIEGQGRGKRNSELLINNFKIDHAAARQILDNFDSKRERVDIL